MKRIYKVLIIIGIGILIVLGIYLGWRAITSEPEEEAEPPTPGTGGTPAAPVSTDQIKKLSDQDVFDFWVNPATSEIFYFTPDGRVMNAKEGPDLEISKQKISALNFIEIELGGQKVLAAFGDPRSPQWGIFDVVDGVWRPLPAEITNAAWGRNDEELIVVVKSGNDLNLAEADVTRTPPSYRTLIRDFRLKDIKLTLVAEDRLIISELPVASYAGSLLQLNLDSLSFDLLIAAENGLSISWSADKKLAFLWGSDSGFLVLDENLRTKMPTPFNTLPQKCAADSSNAYCFVPQNVPSDTTLPDDYLLKKFFSVDDLIVSGIESGGFTKTLTSNAALIPAIDAKNPRVLGDKLYFVNRYDNQLYELDL